jgi:signal transduction histidine kinase
MAAPTGTGEIATMATPVWCRVRTAAVAAPGQITVRVAGQAAEVAVEVTDTGPGVPPPDRERIFERFTRLDGNYAGGIEGNGLGLAIARGIATAHSGTLTCTGRAAGGARLELRLPRSR